MHSYFGFRSLEESIFAYAVLENFGVPSKFVNKTIFDNESDRRL